MDQVDGIIISTLNSLGCDLEPEVTSLDQFGMAETVVGVVQCLRALAPERCSGITHKLPHNMAQRFRAAAEIAQEVKSLGYTGDLGYQSLLYPNVVDVRRLFSFLLERLPRDAADMQQEPLTTAGLLLAAARNRLHDNLSQPWVPPHCRPALLKRRLKQMKTAAEGKVESEKEDPTATVFEMLPFGDTRHLRPFRGYHLLRVGKEGGNVCIGGMFEYMGEDKGTVLLCSALAAHARQLRDGQLLLPLTMPGISSLNIKEELQPLVIFSTRAAGSVFPNPPSMELLSLAESKSLDSLAREGYGIEGGVGGDEERLKVMLDELLQQRQDYEIQIRDVGAENEKLSVELQAVQQQVSQAQDKLQLLQRTLQVLPQTQENNARLQAVVDGSEAKMTRMKEQFNAHCAPLQLQLQQLNRQLDDQQLEQQRLMKEVTALRAERRDLQQRTPQLRAQAEQLRLRLEARGTTVSRSVYTKRILELTGRVHQQRQATEAALEDVRKMQKEINSLAGKIDRSFTVIEEVSYKASWSGIPGLYRSVIELHDTCSAIVDVIRETGAIKRRVAELNEQVALEQRRDTATALAKLQEDLSQVKRENAASREKAKGQQ